MEETFKMQMDQYLPLRDVVFRTLREAILQGELKPGERLMEIQLANRLGVSRTPIREAIRMLELEGLVVMIPRRGAVVAEISEKNLVDVLEVRRVLEELAAELAAERIGEDALAELEKTEREFEQKLKAGDVNDIAHSDEAFHYIILQSTDNQKLLHLLQNFREQMYRYRAEYLKQTDQYPKLVDDHREILKQIAKRDQKAAAQAMYMHIDRQQQIMMETVRKNSALKENPADPPKKSEQEI